MSNALHIAGELGTDDFPDLLQLLSSTRRTGTLVVRGTGNEAREKRLVFRQGTILSTSSTDPNEHLGHFLVSHGFLDEETLARAIQMQDRSRMLLGKILLDLGVIAESDLEAMLRLKAEETVFDLFTWDGASFEFLSDRVPDFALVPLAVDVDSLLLKGARRIDEERRIRELVPSPHCVPVAVARLDAPAEDPQAAQILALVNDDRSVREIALEAHAGDFAVGRVLTEQLLAGKLKIVRPRTLAPEPAPAAPAEPPAAEPEAPDGGVLEAGRLHLDAGNIDGAYRALGRVREQVADEAGRKAADGLAEDIRRALVAQGLRPDAVPRLVGELDALPVAALSAEEGFLVSRIDGRYDLAAILKITPMDPLAALIAVWHLVSAGTVRLT